MTLITGQVLCQMGGLTITVDSDDATGKIAQFTLVNNDGRAYTFTFTLKGNPQSRTIQPGANLTFTPPQNGVKWLTDAIEWSVA